MPDNAPQPPSIQNRQSGAAGCQKQMGEFALRSLQPVLSINPINVLFVISDCCLVFGTGWHFLQFPRNFSRWSATWRNPIMFSAPRSPLYQPYLKKMPGEFNDTGNRKL